MIEIIKLKKTCHACPAQWEGITSKNEPIYIRYRWGDLSIRIGKPDEDITFAINGEEILSASIGSSMDGCLSSVKLVDIIKQDSNICFNTERMFDGK